MNKTKEIVVLALLAALLFVQEQALTFLPNIQLTVFLLIVYSKMLGYKKTLVIIFVHVLLDNLIMSSMNPLFMTFMLTGWSMIPIILHIVKVESSMGLALLSIVFAFIYSWVYIIPNVLVYEMDFMAYLMADIPFEVLLSMSSFITTLWLYEPCRKVFIKYL